MSRGSQWVYPNSCNFPGQDAPQPGDVFGGLTKRELFAALAMQGYLASFVENDISPDAAAESAVEYADALLAELEKTEAKS